MEINGMMEMAKRQSYLWWFDSHSNNSPRHSQWLQSTLSELDEMTKSMLMIIDQEADSFAQRAEMYYKKRPQLISLVEDFYRTHRSLAIQFDHLKQDPATRRTSSLVRSFSLSKDEPERAIMGPRKSYDGSCITKLAYDSDSDSIGSEVDDPILILEVKYDLMAEIDRLKEDAMIQTRKFAEKEKAMEEMKRKLDEACNEVMELKEEAEKLRLENVMKIRIAEEKEQLMDSEVNYDLMAEIDRLKEDATIQARKFDEKEKAMEEMKRKLDEACNEVMELKEEAEKLRLENVMKIRIAEEKEQLMDSEVNYDLMAEIDRLKEDATIQARKFDEKEKAMEEMKRKLDEACNEVMELKEETEKLRLENVELYQMKMRISEEKEQLMDSEVNYDDLMDEIDRLKEEAMIQIDEKEKAMEEMKRKLDEACNEVTELKLRLENDEEKERLRMNLMEEKEQLIDENERQKQMLEEKDDEKREVIKQLSLAIEMLRSENLVIKKLFANERVKKRNTHDQFQGLKGFQKLFFNCLTVRPDPFFL